MRNFHRTPKSSCTCNKWIKTSVTKQSNSLLESTLNSAESWCVYWKVQSARTKVASRSVTSLFSCWSFSFFINPFIPLWHRSSLYRSRHRYSASRSVLLRHCTTAFMKQVFPWFFRPSTPGVLSPYSENSFSLAEERQGSEQLFLTWLLSSFLTCPEFPAQGVLSPNPPSSSSASERSVVSPPLAKLPKLFKILPTKLSTDLNDFLRNSLPVRFVDFPESLIAFLSRLSILLAYFPPDC